MIDIQDSLFKDIEAVRQISIIPTMLEVICQTTGMGFAAIARVTNDKWLACSVWDEVQFGLEEGGELQVETTLCNEIRDSRKPIIIDHVDKDPHYCNHHTPKIYGLQSYISFPIILKDGTFFGTLCAIDSKPADVNNSKIIGMFTMFTDLLAFHLQSQDLLERSYNANIKLQDKNKILSNTNFDLDTFVYTVSHDLKAPISNIEGLIDALSDTVSKENLDRGEIKKIVGLMKSSLKRFAVTIRNLTTVVESEANSDGEIHEAVNIPALVEEVKQDLNQQIAVCNARIEVICEDNLLVNFSKKNLKSILYNLVSNAIKYRSPERPAEILVKVDKVDEKTQLTVKDNGLGIPHHQQNKVFTMFKRLHDHVEGSGIGLYIVKRIIDNMNGQIRVDSTLNQGTTFTVIF
ncbi:GAF domain-containing sensor histidine kinase [Pontibacter sp. 172403-2]|uniref:sensor histidine kinase n=1 Tax=Pontibacter rufus TaxID=2791028 RepID=UPI0018AFF58E|nr:GAF domain-containing sensor histidine kinase [Pontibacter sp. 172403-2]MBF9255100.1 GAF domain-containing sensor histidine kinase [Pontibacter sp. 172403-2]